MKTFSVQIIFFAVFALTVPCMAEKELQVWTMADGTSFEAALVTVFSSEAAFKNGRGKIKKLPLDCFTPESQIRIEMANPPRLSINFVKDENSQIFPMGINEKTARPPEKYCHYGVRIKQISSGRYKHPLHVELFVIGSERLGDQYILLDRQTGSFFLTKGNKQEFEMRGERQVILRNFTIADSIRGEKFYGYLVVVTDEQGETIAMDCSHAWLFENFDTLSQRYAGNFIDKSCARVFPSRPPEF